jgi:RimJ/RimL family protein N-acetyltransferase
MYTFQNNRVRLRALTSSDIEANVLWMNDVEVTRNLGRVGRFSYEQEAAYVERAQHNTADHYGFAIEAIEGPQPKYIGNIDLFSFDQRNRQAELGIMIGDHDYWGKGYGPAAIQLLLEFGFGELNLHRIYLRVYDFNKRGIRAYEKVGFKVEGIARQAAYSEGAYHDDYEMSILKPEWEALYGSKV